MLVLLLGVSLSAGAKEETKIDTEELRSVLTLNMYQAEKVTAQNYLDFPMSGVFFGPKDILFREVIGLGIITGKEPVVSVDDLDPKKYLISIIHRYSRFTIHFLIKYFRQLM